MTPADLAMPCPICLGRSRRAFVTHGHGVRDCERCGHRFAELVPDESHVETVYGDDYFNGGGAGYTDYLAGAPLLRAHGKRYGELARRHAPPGRLLDVGAAAGYILKGFQDAGWQGCGFDPNPAMALHAREVLGLDVQCGMAEDYVDAGPFDLISMIQVVAHLADPMKALANMARLTRPGGLWLIETWDYRSWTARLAGERWHEYSPPSVLHWFTRPSLGALVGRFGFTVIAHGRPRKYMMGAHAKSLLRYKFAGRPLAPVVELAARLVPDEAVLPYPAEDLFWVLCRKS